jgi:hypothetical protein
MPQGKFLCSYLKQANIYFSSFFLIHYQRTGRQNRSCLGGLVHMGRRERGNGEGE